MKKILWNMGMALIVSLVCCTFFATTASAESHEGTIEGGFAWTRACPRHVRGQTHRSGRQCGAGRRPALRAADCYFIKIAGQF